MSRILTGIQSSGDLHIGNYFGAMKPMIDAQNSGDHYVTFMIADLHTFTSLKDPEKFRKYQRASSIDWMACGVDPEKMTLFQQSDIRAHTELTWLLACHTSMGMLERAHAFKDKTAKGIEANVGLFTYPILMACDILLYDTDIVPVGKDQKQHVEMARDIAQRFNHHYGETFVLPDVQIDDEVKTIPGLDGAKMSKSYGNTIEIFAEESVIKKKIMSIQTESLALGDPIPLDCTPMLLHRLFENPNLPELEKKCENGEVGFGDVKKQLFGLIWEYFAEARKKREVLLADPGEVERILKMGAGKANAKAEEVLQRVRNKMGMEKHLV